MIHKNSEAHSKGKWDNYSGMTDNYSIESLFANGFQIQFHALAADQDR